MQKSQFLPSTALLYLIAILSWSGAWYALKLQAGTVSPMVSVSLRFLLSAPVIFLLVHLRKEPLNYPVKTHARFALVGALMFSINFIFAYCAAYYLTSALISVVFSLSAVMALILGWLLSGEKPRLMAVIGSLAGTLGLCFLLWTEVEGSGTGDRPVMGLALALCMTISFSLGNLVSASLQRDGVATFPLTAWAMAWGGGLSALAATLTGQSWAIEWTIEYIGSLVFLVLLGSVAAFLAYIALIGKVGAFRAAYTTVIVPIVAFAISSWLEDYQWTSIGVFGLFISALGNVLILKSKQAK